MQVFHGVGQNCNNYSLLKNKSQYANAVFARHLSYPRKGTRIKDRFLNFWLSLPFCVAFDNTSHLDRSEFT